MLIPSGGSLDRLLVWPEPFGLAIIEAFLRLTGQQMIAAREETVAA